MPASNNTNQSSAFRVLSANDPGSILKARLLSEARRHFSDRQEVIRCIDSIELIRKRRKKIREVLTNINGPFPERTPLNARTTGTIRHHQHTIEKIIFESHSGHHVTANLYLPINDVAPVPGVIVPCGHSRMGKAYPSYQQLCILLARNGIAALIYDPTGQGERRQLLDANNQPVTGPGNEHTLEGIGAWLTGTGTANYMIWDGIRALDYLAARPEVDAERLGCTGNSGGGTLTTYLTIFDPRIRAAAPSCWLTSQQRMFETIGPQDSEQNFPGGTALGIEHADLLLAAAPTPILMCTATYDEFDIDGAKATFQEAQYFYKLLGCDGKLQFFEYADKHGFTPPRREAAVRFLRHWLKRDNAYNPEEEQDVHPEEELWCTESGQVLPECGGISVYDINSRRAAYLDVIRSTHQQKSKCEVLAQVQRLTGTQLPVHPPTVTNLGFIPTTDEVELGYGTEAIIGNEHSTAQTGALYTIEKIVITREDGFPIAGILLTPLAKTSNQEVHNAHQPHQCPAILHVSGQGKPSDMTSGNDVARLAELTKHVSRGKIVFSIDVRGFGETAADDAPAWSRIYFGTDYETAFLSINLNRPLIGQRAEDMLAALHYLASHVSTDENAIELIAEGSAGPAALHAATFDKRITKVYLIRSIISWQDVVNTSLGKDQLTNVVPFALEHYDLPDLVDIIAPRPVEIVDPVDPTGKTKYESASSPISQAVGLI